MRRSSCLVFAVVICSASGSALAQNTYSPYVGDENSTTVYWGDTHLHTEKSVDAYGFGDRIGAEDAYRFAKGATVRASNGMPARLRRPLDFLVIADHAESIGVMGALQAKNPALLQTEAGKRIVRRFEETEEKGVADLETLKALLDIRRQIFPPADRPNINQGLLDSVWRQVMEAADRHNDPGDFTAFIGFEWTSMGRSKDFGNIHRVVIFRDSADKAKQVLPFSSFDSGDPERLWDYMAQYEKDTGGEILAIPHNGNLSDGEMFALQNYSGVPLSRTYAERRRRWEPLYEVTQIKGSSEAHPYLSPTDEFSDSEIWNSLDGTSLLNGRTWNAAERALKEGEYARAALKRGLRLEAELGANPFKFGMIGSTDAHTSLSAVEENNFWGKAPLTNPGKDRLAADKLNSVLPVVLNPKYPARAWQMASSGYAAVWATENTRAALFDAMKRKETYATTGPRITVRFFGGWDYVSGDALKPDLALIGYNKGVPMGGDLTNAPAGKAPRFLIWAMKDPDGANLDRVQVIKGWRDLRGELHERIYNVALSDGRREGKDGKAPPVGSTVNLKDASYTNTIGAPELAVVWTDPDFDPSERAFYYVRVLEIPTPRWSAYDAKFFKIENVPAQIPMVTQERAHTSPIWYTPRP